MQASIDAEQACTASRGLAAYLMFRIPGELLLIGGVGSLLLLAIWVFIVRPQVRTRQVFVLQC